MSTSLLTFKRMSFSTCGSAVEGFSSLRQLPQDVFQRARRRRKNVGKETLIATATFRARSTKEARRLPRCSRIGHSSRSLFFRALRRHDYLTPFHDTVDVAQQGPTSAALYRLFFEVKHEKFSRLN